MRIWCDNIKDYNNKRKENKSKTQNISWQVKILSKSGLKRKYREEEDQLDIEDIYDDYDGIVVDGIDKEEEKMLEDIEEDWYGYHRERIPRQVRVNIFESVNKNTSSSNQSIHFVENSRIKDNPFLQKDIILFLEESLDSMTNLVKDIREKIPAYTWCLPTSNNCCLGLDNS